MLLQFVLLTSYGLDGFAHAAEALVGRTIGARDLAGFRSHVRAAAEWSLLTAALAALAFALLGEVLIALLTGIPEVRVLAAAHLPWMVAMPLLAVGSYLLDGIFIGATRAAAMRDTMLASVLAVYLPLWYLTQPLGSHGLWLAFLGFTVARSLLLGAVFLREWRRGQWFAGAAASG